MKKATQGEVADYLGVSRATVSRVMRNVAGPKSSTAVRIIEAARELGYRLPATKTSAMRKGAGRQKSTTLGLFFCLPDNRAPNSTEVLMKMLHGATDATREHNVLLHVEYISESDAALIRNPKDVPALLRSKQVSGVLVAGLVPTSAVAAIAKLKPCVRMNIHDSGLKVDFVGQDDRTAVDDIVACFKAEGHRQIGFYCERPVASFALSRFSGYIEALAQRGLPYDPRYSVNIWEPAGVDVFDRIAEAVRSGVRAWICPHDEIGYDLIEQLQSRGLRVPEDFSVCGFDFLHTRHGMKAMTTIDWPLEDMAAAGIAMLLQRINEPARTLARLLFSGRLIERETVGSCR